MPSASHSALSRRSFLAATGALVAAASVRMRVSEASTAVKEFRIAAQSGKAALVGGKYPETAVWAYNEIVPGPEIRIRQGDRIRVVVKNNIAEASTVHWHGLRVPNVMDGVPHLTQKPIDPGENFVYEFDAPDAGTYWYHPHQRSFEQVGRGLYGPLIIEEKEPIAVDRDVVWVLDDWRLGRDGQISDDFGNRHDMSHNGRVGNTVTVNGKIEETFAVRGGERVRLRLINAANARIFGLEFAGHRPQVIAYDGQPVEPHEPDGGRVVLGPAMRADLLLDMTGSPGDRFTIKDTFYRGLAYRLLDIHYENTSLRERPRETPIALPPNTMPEPDLSVAERHEVVFNGGMMGGMMMGGGRNMMEMMHSGKMWFINGMAATGHIMKPLLTLQRGRSYIIAMHNDTAWHHPIHLHGHSFRVVSRNGQLTRHREWQDTVLMAPRERVEIACVADNPGDWMFHCHILEHQAAGMMGVIRVTREETRT